MDWVVRIRLENMKDMMSKFDGMGSTREKEGLLCHRVISVLLDTVAITGRKRYTSCICKRY